MTIQAKYKLKGTLEISGDKSISHRSLILSSIAIGETKINNLLESEDVKSTIRNLKQLGVKIRKKSNRWIVNGVGTGGFQQPNQVINSGNSGTTSRLILGLIASNPIYCTIIGDKSLSGRPMSRVTNILEKIGAKIQLTKRNYLPLTIEGTLNALPLKHVITKPSAQIKSSIMLAALNIHGQTTVIETRPTRDHTEIMFKYLNVKFKKKKLKNGSTEIKLKGPYEISAKNIDVASDPSSAAFFIVAALITPGSNILLKNICLNKSRIAYIKILKKMGGNITVKNEKKLSGEIVGSIKAKYSKLKAIKISKNIAPYLIDEYPILAIAATQAQGTSIMKGLAELRVKESDRLNSIYTNLKSCGIDTKIKEDDLYITGSSDILIGGNKINSYHDHRIAMSFSILNLICKNQLRINNLKCISISYPNFNKDLKNILRNG